MDMLYLKKSINCDKMGVAEEWEELEHKNSEQMSQLKRQVSSLTDALSKMTTNKAKGSSSSEYFDVFSLNTAFGVYEL